MPKEPEILTIIGGPGDGKRIPYGKGDQVIYTPKEGAGAGKPFVYKKIWFDKTIPALAPKDWSHEKIIRHLLDTHRPSIQIATA